MNILVSSSGRRVELLECIRAVSGGMVVAADCDRTAPTLQLADERAIVPDLNSRLFIDAIMATCARHDVSLIVPTIDPELAVYAEHRETLLVQGIRVAVSSPRVVAQLADKLVTAQVIQTAGLQPISTVEWSTGTPPFEYPVVVKPRRGSAGVGVRVIPHSSEWTPPPRSGQWVVQPWIRAPEVTLDAVADARGKLVALGARRRLKVRGGEVERARTEPPEGYRSIAERLAPSLGLEGPFNVQLFDTPDGYLVGEINPRFGGGVPLSERAGGGLVEAVCTWGRTGSWPTGNTRLAKPGCYMLRYDRSVFVAEAALP